MIRWVGATLAFLSRLFRGVPRRVHDMTDDPLPLYLRRSAGDWPTDPDDTVRHVGHCRCGTIYMRRPPGSVVAEDGQCYRCSTGAEREAMRPRVNPAPVAKFDPSRRLRGRQK